MRVVPISAFSDNYIWAIVNDSNQSFMVVDPGEARPVLAFAKANQLDLTAILLTHHHADHTGGVIQLLSYFPHIPVYGPADARMPMVNHPVKAHDVLTWDALQLTVFDTPGHTSSHISYYSPAAQWLFCGDTLFSGGCGRIFDGSVEALYHSLQQLLSLPNDTQIYCAHEYTQQNLRFARTIEPDNQQIAEILQDLEQNKIACSLPSTLQREKEINPFFRINQPMVIYYAKSLGADGYDPLSVFLTLREAKNHFTG